MAKKQRTSKRAATKPRRNEADHRRLDELAPPELRERLRELGERLKGLKRAALDDVRFVEELHRLRRLAPPGLLPPGLRDPLVRLLPKTEPRADGTLETRWLAWSDDAIMRALARREPGPHRRAASAPNPAPAAAKDAPPPPPSPKQALAKRAAEELPGRRAAAIFRKIDAYYPDEIPLNISASKKLAKALKIDARERSSTLARVCRWIRESTAPKTV